jgi:hypothetical protein
MVYAFFVGMTVGLPVGCYLREAGYASKFKNAYSALVKQDDSKQLDQFKNNSARFYENLKKGQVDPKEFERYIYGGTYAKRNQDESDKMEVEMQKKVNDYLK